MLGGAKPPPPSDTPPMLGGAKAALPLGASVAIDEQPPYIPPNSREGRLIPTRSTQCKGHTLIMNFSLKIFTLYT